MPHIRAPEAMPVVNLQITLGATREQKAAVVADFTDALVRHFGKRPEHFHIIVQEIDDENCCSEGNLTDDCRLRQASAAEKTVQITPIVDSWLS